MRLLIRPETQDDHEAVASVVGAAFETQAEARIVEEIRQSDGYVADMALVAESDGQIVGHVMVSHATLHRTADSVPVALLAPLAVLPDRQRSGIGGELVRAVCEIADEREEPLVLLEGSPAYYPRFGFEPAHEHGITMPLPDWAPPAAGQVLLLNAYEPSLRGSVVYPPAFEVAG